MPDGEEQRESRRFIFALLAVFGGLSALVFWPFASFVILGFLLAYVCLPVFRRLKRRVKSPHAAAGITVLLLVLLILAPLVYISFALVGDALAITRNLDTDTVQGHVDDLRDRVNLILRPTAEAGGGKVTTIDKLVVVLTPQLRQFFGTFFFEIVNFISRLTIGFFVTGFVVYYALLDGPRAIDYLKSTLPLSPVHKERLFGEVRRTVDGVFLGQILASAIQGAIGGLGFLLFGIPNPVFWGLVMVILSILPFLGAFIVWFPAGVGLLLFGDTMNGIGLLLWGAILVSNVDNVVKPKLIGHHAKMHPAIVLVGVIGGLFAFGFIGFVLGPLVVSMFIAVLNVWRDQYAHPHVAQRASAEAPKPAAPVTPVDAGRASESGQPASGPSEEGQPLHGPQSRAPAEGVQGAASEGPESPGPPDGPEVG